MRWMAVLLGLSLLGCGGRSREAGGKANAAGDGTGGAAPTIGGAGGAVGGASSAAGAASGGVGAAAAGGSDAGPGTAVWQEVVNPGDSAECVAYKNNPDVVATCLRVDLYCALELKNWVATMVEDNGLDDFYARQGCGLIEMRSRTLGGSTTHVFDSDGKRVGYQERGDSSHGPCEAFGYGRGLHLEGCADVHDCLIAPSAADGGELCRCDCPSEPPERAPCSFSASPDPQRPKCDPLP